MDPVDIPQPLPGFVPVTFAERQPQYRTLPALVEQQLPEKVEKGEWHGAVLTRWRPTAEELTAILAGDDLYLEVWAFGNTCRRCGERHGLQPVKIGVWSDRVACEPGEATGLADPTK